MKCCARLSGYISCDWSIWSNKAYVWDLTARIWVAFKVLAGIKQKWFLMRNCNWFLAPWQTEKDTKSITTRCKLFIWLYYEFSKNPNLAARKGPSFWRAAERSSAARNRWGCRKHCWVPGLLVPVTFLLDGHRRFSRSAGNTAMLLNVGRRAGEGNINISHPVLKSEVPSWIKRMMNLSDEQMFESWSRWGQRFTELFRGGFSAAVNWRCFNGAHRKISPGFWEIYSNDLALFWWEAFILKSSVPHRLSG